MKSVATFFVLLLLLHQDFWNWSSGNLLFGFLPTGLAYHAIFSILCSVLGAIAIQRVWPADVEDE